MEHTIYQGYRVWHIPEDPPANQQSRELRLKQLKEFCKRHVKLVVVHPNNMNAILGAKPQLIVLD